MSSENYQRKVLSNNALKTNFISNTNNNSKLKLKSDNQKAYSNLSKDKQTVHKNNNRVYEKESSLQDSATILPHKNQKNNIYTNQNINQINHPNLNQINPTNVQINYHSQNQNMHAYQVKDFPVRVSKSPYDRNQKDFAQLNMKKTIKPDIPDLAFQKGKTYSEKIIKTQRQNSNANQEYEKLQKAKSNPKKLPLRLSPAPQREQNNFELTCDQQFNDFEQFPQQSRLQRKSSNTATINSKYNTAQKFQTSLIHGRQFDEQVFGNQLQKKTQKKHVIIDKNTYLFQKTQSQQNISVKTTKTSARNYSNNSHQASNSHKNISLATFNQQMKKFSKIQDAMNANSEVQTLFKLEIRQKQYSVEPNYIEKRQRHFNWSMRAVLIDWMVHVCYEFSLKRQTCHIAVALVDKYLQTYKNLPKSDFQLTGAACMFIASKLQQFEPLSSGQFSKSTDNRYSPEQILQSEHKICKALKFQLNPPTLYMWANRLMLQWDQYIQLSDAIYHPFFANHQPKHFKKQSQQSYKLFRQMMQMLDCSILEVQTLQFPPKILVCSFMYIILGKNYKEWSVKQIIQIFPRSSKYLRQQAEGNCFNHLFHNFLNDSFNLSLLELLPSIQYCSTFFTLHLTYETPLIAEEEDQQSKMGFQEYQSYQTYNGKMIELVKKRFRGVYS